MCRFWFLNDDTRAISRIEAFFAPRSKGSNGRQRCIVIGVMMKHKINADVLKVMGSCRLRSGQIDTEVVFEVAYFTLCTLPPRVSALQGYTQNRLQFIIVGLISHDAIGTPTYINHTACLP